MPNYQKGKIYELVDLTNNNKYYGSTVQDLKLRKSGHVRDYKCFLNKKTNYISSFEIIKNNNYEIYLVEEFPCNSKSELEAREGYYIRNNNCINKNIPGRTRKENHKQWSADNKEKLKKYHKEWRDDNKEKIKETDKQKIKQYQKQYRIDNKECTKKYLKQYKQYKKSWGGDPRYNNNLLKIDLTCFI